MLKQEQDDISLEEQAPTLETSAMAAVDNIDSTVKILLVEDNIITLKALKMLFISYKLHVIEAQNAEDAFELVRRGAFNLIITDIGLPGMQGDELIAKIRQLEKETGRARGKIVALTGYEGKEELADECKKAGVDELFKKPMQPELLKILLEPWIKKRPEKIKLIREPTVDVVLQEEHSQPREGKLDIDLPDTEAQLFKIDHYPLLDLNVAENVVGSKEFAKDILKDLKKEGIDPDLENLKKAHAIGDWKTVEALAHKIKGGSTMGTVRLYYALLYLERYLRTGHTHCAEELYSQTLQVIDETVDYLDQHL